MSLMVLNKCIFRYFYNAIIKHILAFLLTLILLLPTCRHREFCVLYILLLAPLLVPILYFGIDIEAKIDTDTATTIFCQISADTDRTLNCQYCNSIILHVYLFNNFVVVKLYPCCIRIYLWPKLWLLVGWKEIYIFCSPSLFDSHHVIGHV